MLRKFGRLVFILLAKVSGCIMQANYLSTPFSFADVVCNLHHLSDLFVQEQDVTHDL